jgi:hypothetical protein
MCSGEMGTEPSCCVDPASVGNCSELLRRSCERWELFRVVGAMFGVAFLDPFP